MRATLILLTMFIIVFMTITFYPTRFDPSQIVYMQHNKTNTIYEQLYMGEGKLNSINSTIQYMMLDNNWNEHGYHPYAFVKDYDLSKYSGCTGMKMTYVQTSLYHQNRSSCNDGTCVSGGTETGNSCGFIAATCFYTAYRQKHMTPEEWTNDYYPTWPGHPNYEGSYGVKIKDYFNFGDKVVCENVGGKKYTKEQIKEVIDKGGTLVYSVNVSSSIGPQSGGHVQAINGYITQEGNISHIIVNDSTNTSGIRSRVESSQGHIVLGHLYLVPVDYFISNCYHVGVYNVIYPTNPPTANEVKDNSSTSSSSQSAFTDFVWPISGVPRQELTDVFCADNRKGHGALDISRAGLDHPDILAAYDGIVYKSGWHVGGRGYGYCVILKHSIGGETCFTKYNHMKSVAVTEGDNVKAGDKIGVCGGTENDPNVDTFDVHLDFQMYTDYTGDPGMNLVNPSSLLLGRVTKIADCTVFKRNGNSQVNTVLKTGKDAAYANKPMAHFRSQLWSVHDSLYK